MLLTILSVFIGYFVGSGKRGTRMWKMLGIVLGMAFFLGLILSVIFGYQSMRIENLSFIILPVGTSQVIDLIGIQFGMNLMVTYLAVALISMGMTFFWFLVGKGSKWLISRRGL